MISELRDTAKVSLEDYLKMEREKKLNEESLMNQVTQLQNDKDELKTEIFKLKHKVEKVRVFRVYFWPESLTVKFQAGFVEPMTLPSAPFRFLTWSYPKNVSKDSPKNCISDFLVISAQTGYEIFKPEIFFSSWIDGLKAWRVTWGSNIGLIMSYFLTINTLGCREPAWNLDSQLFWNLSQVIWLLMLILI